MKKLKLAKPKKVNKTRIKKCPTCEKEFLADRDTNPAKFCSRACGYKSRMNRTKAKCKHCGKDFEFRTSQLKAYKGAGQYCSKHCAGEGLATRHASDPVADKYGRTKRRADHIWQKAVREKYEYTCKRCGKFEKYIHAHHVAPRSQRPDLKHELSNGICLCNSCHTWVHHHPKEAVQTGLLSTEKYESSNRFATYN